MTKESGNLWLELSLALASRKFASLSTVLAFEGAVTAFGKGTDREKGTVNVDGELEEGLN